MSSFRALQAQHETLIRKVQTGEDVSEEAQKFIHDVKSSSSRISASNEREQLMSNLRYWASYLYEHTGTYPNVDLAPSTLAPRSNRVLPVAIFAGILLLTAIALAIAGLRNQSTAQVTPTLGLTQSDLPTEPAATEMPVATETPTEQPISVMPTQANAISIQFTSVHDGDTVSPTTRISGTYTNLPAGSSIHVLVQPLSRGGLRFPVKQYASVASNSTSGEWSIEARFGQGAELKEKEEYLISVVAATSEDARQELVAASESGLQNLPSGVIPFPQTVSVNRAAYSTVIDGARLIYSSYLEAEGNFEIYSSNLDGSDQRRVTYTSGVSELFASLSQDGKQIVYVGRRRDNDNRAVYSVETINSDGTSPETIVEPQENLIYERPLWSSDGAYIAYVTGDVSSGGQTIWNLALYDLAKKTSTVLIEGNRSGPRYTAWIPNSHELVFNSRIEGTEGFRKIDISTPGEQQVYFNSTGEELQPTISADGSLLAYMQLDNTIGNIYMVDLSDGKTQQLTRNQFTGSSPAWAPDAKTIFFQFYGDGAFNIWSIDTEGGKPVQLTFGLQDMYPFAGYMYALVP